MDGLEKAGGGAVGGELRAGERQRARQAKVPGRGKGGKRGGKDAAGHDDR